MGARTNRSPEEHAALDAEDAALTREIPQDLERAASLGRECAVLIREAGVRLQGEPRPEDWAHAKARLGRAFTSYESSAFEWAILSADPVRNADLIGR